MRLHILSFAIFVIYAQAATIPDKRDIEKKLTDAAKEVLSNEKPAENISSEQELIDAANSVKDVENNLRKTPQEAAGIPVKVVVENVEPELKSEKKENNEVVPESEESSEIKREEIDLKNPGPPQRTQHDNQNPENFEDAQQAVQFKTAVSNTAWSDIPQYAELKKQMVHLRENLNQKIDELDQSIKNYIQNTKPVETVAKETEDDQVVKLRATSAREDNQCNSSPAANSSAPWGTGPFAGWFSGLVPSFQKLNESLTGLVNNNNQTQQTQNGANAGNGFFQFGNILNQQNSSSPVGAQSDEPNRPNLWQSFQSLWPGNQQQQQQPPQGAQQDSPQPAPAPATGPIASAFQNVVNFFNRPGQAQPAAPAPAPAPPAPATAQEGTNAVPVDPKPEGEKYEKPQQNAQTQTIPQQSGPIKQLIGNNPIVQGIAGAVQRIHHAVTSPEKPRDEPTKEPITEAQATKAGFYKPHVGSPTAVDVNYSRITPKNIVPITNIEGITAPKSTVVEALNQNDCNPGDPIGDINDSSGVAVKSDPEVEVPKVPAEKEPVKEEKAPVEDKTQTI